MSKVLAQGMVRTQVHMLQRLIIGFFAVTAIYAQDIIVRVYTPSWVELKRISETPLDIAAGQCGAWYDLVVDQHGLSQVIASGLPYEVLVYSLEYEKDKVRGAYLSYTEINDSLKNNAENYPAICAFDSLPIPTYEGRWIYGVKISDNVNLTEEHEAKFTIDGCHHSREWATPQAVLFFADSMLRSYGNVPEITEIINTTEIFCFPVINVDGYVYDYPAARWWRKNREPFGDTVGTDPNRNYGGACNGELEGYWGGVEGWSASHYPASELFCGAYAYSGDEIQAYTTYIRDHKITTGFSLHSYGEFIMYPWGYKPQGCPDSILYMTKGNHMAAMMERLSGGKYFAGQSYYNPYPTNGNTRDWVYGYNKWVAGLSSLFYGAEIGTEFYQDPSDLDFISLQVFKAAQYLAGFADSLMLVAEGFVPQPYIYPLGTVDKDFVVYWHARNSYDNHPIDWELIELSRPSIIQDSLELGTNRWILEGFTLSMDQSHSGSYSLFSGNVNNMHHGARTAHPYLVQAGDSLTFWCWYDLQDDQDVAIVEASENTKEWFAFDDRYSGNSGGWIRRSYSLSEWAGKSIYLRFRSMTDDDVINSGFYVDDIYPVSLFEDVDTISSSITDTSYQFTNHPEGVYYYYVRGRNTPYGWGNYSCLEEAEVSNGIAESEKFEFPNINPSVTISPNPSRDRVQIKWQVINNGQGKDISLKIYDIAGRLIKGYTIHSCSSHPQSSITWECVDNDGRVVPLGVYFIHFKTGSFNTVKKVTLLRQ